MSGQWFRLQERYLTRTPWQYLPPFDGTGLLHSLLDSWTPPPHVREQEPNGPHLPQRPSTWKHTNKLQVEESNKSHNQQRWNSSEHHLHVLGLFVRADASIADPSVATVCAVRPGEVSSHAHQMSVGFSCAPQAAAWRLHEGTRLGAFSKREHTLAVKAVGRSRRHVGEDKRFLRLVEQTFT